MGSQPPRTPAATQWLDRAKASYRGADFEDARDATRHALAVAPNDAEIRELAARIALVHLEYTDALRLTEGLSSTDAHSIGAGPTGSPAIWNMPPTSSRRC
jgi:predicted Zn-dependent protease